jgi:type III secretion system FlhB-like substrate exporter
MSTSTEELIKAVNELKVEIQRIREIVDLLLNVVIEGEIEEDLRQELQFTNLRDIDPFSIYN